MQACFHLNVDQASACTTLNRAPSAPWGPSGPLGQFIRNESYSDWNGYKGKNFEGSWAPSGLILSHLGLQGLILNHLAFRIPQGYQGAPGAPMAPIYV